MAWQAQDGAASLDAAPAGTALSDYPPPGTARPGTTPLDTAPLDTALLDTGPPATASPGAAVHDIADAAPLLSHAEFAALMALLGPWPPGRRVAVAVSGGADSLCLAWLLAQWGAPVAFIVDHRLRPRSAAEAARAAATLRGFGVPAHILPLAGLSLGPGLQARARAARYATLEAACRDHALTDLLLGHHAADQAETLLLRQEDASGPAGLAGMAAVVETRGLRRVRPLLSVTPDRLRSTLVRAGLTWSEDPSNANPDFSRVRWRQALRQPAPKQQIHAPPGAPLPNASVQAAPAATVARPVASPSLPGTEALAKAAHRHGLARVQTERSVAAFLARHAQLRPEGFVLLAQVDFPAGALAALLRAFSGAQYAPGAARLARLLPAGASGTIAGMRLMSAGRLGPGRLLVREAAALPPPVALHAGAVWDARFAVSAGAPCPERATLGALGRDARLYRRHSALPAAVLATLPAIRQDGRITDIPHLRLGLLWTNPAFRLRLAPLSPAAGAAFLPMPAARS